jgi:hypothetical protein
MNQWTQGYCLTKKTRGQKSRATVPLKRKHQNETIHFAFCFCFDFIQPLFLDKIKSKFVRAFNIYVRIYLNSFSLQTFQILQNKETKTKRLID